MNVTEQFAEGSGLLVQSGQGLNFFTSVEASDGSIRYVPGTCNTPSYNTVSMKVYLTHGLTSAGDLTITSAGNTEFSTQPWYNTAMDREAMASFIDQLVAGAKTSNVSLSLIACTGANATGASLIDTFTSGVHFVGSARMGADDGTVVVDISTKVHGMDNFYVVDASMHPDLPTGNTQAMVMVAAEHAAEKILADTNVVASASGQKFTIEQTTRNGFRNPHSSRGRHIRSTHLPQVGRRSALRSGLRSY